MRKLTYRKHITRQMLRDEPDTLFVFGDNSERRGLGGQAKEMRGEPNAVGIPTKMYPTMHARAFFTNDDFEYIVPVLNMEFDRLRSHAGPIVWPEDGIGTGLADLAHRAPRIWAYIESGRQALEQSDASPPNGDAP